MNMKLGQACAAIAAARQNNCPEAPLVATMSAMFAFDMLGVTERRIDSVPLMGGAAGLGLGLAMARPDLPVIVVDGDASLLMELGSLVTVAHNRPQRYVHFVCANGVQFNGNRNLPTAGTEPHCDFVAMALAAGYAHAERIGDAAELAAALPRLLAQRGATLVEMVLEPDPAAFGAHNPLPLIPDQQFERMRHAVEHLRTALAA
jgi:thiamine pyrophosphate-dependent acetolactate synthase large subunit-like protein